MEDKSNFLLLLVILCYSRYDRYLNNIYNISIRVYISRVIEILESKNFIEGGRKIEIEPRRSESII